MKGSSCRSLEWPWRGGRRFRPPIPAIHRTHLDTCNRQVRARFKYRRWCSEMMQKRFRCCNCRAASKRGGRLVHKQNFRPPDRRAGIGRGKPAAPRADSAGAHRQAVPVPPRSAGRTGVRGTKLPLATILIYPGLTGLRLSHRLNILSVSINHGTNQFKVHPRIYRSCGGHAPLIGTAQQGDPAGRMAGIRHGCRCPSRVKRRRKAVVLGA